MGAFGQKQMVGTMTSPALELREIGRSWLKGKPIFSKLNLQVSETGFTVLLGPSGCGKSTLLRCAAFLDKPDNGQVFVSGKEALYPSPERQLILQGDNQLLPWLTVEENIRFPVGISGSDSNFKAADLLHAVGLPDAGHLYPAQLSGGMKQRIVLARALAANPSILLLDEPFAALDTVIRSRLQELLLRIHHEHRTAMLLVTHDVTEALVLGDVIVFMDANGHLSPAEGNPLNENRNPDSLDFHKAEISMRSRYKELTNPVHP